MTQDEISPQDVIEMARQAGLETQDGFSESVFYFAKLVAAHTLMNIDPSKFMSYHERNNANTM